MTTSVGQPAPNLSLSDADGRDVELSTLWAEHPVVLFFLRHFG